MEGAEVGQQGGGKAGGGCRCASERRPPPRLRPRQRAAGKCSPPRRDQAACLPRYAGAAVGQLARAQSGPATPGGPWRGAPGGPEEERLSGLACAALLSPMAGAAGGQNDGGLGPMDVPGLRPRLPWAGPPSVCWGRGRLERPAPLAGPRQTDGGADLRLAFGPRAPEHVASGRAQGGGQRQAAAAARSSLPAGLPPGWGQGVRGCAWPAGRQPAGRIGADFRGQPPRCRPSPPAKTSRRGARRDGALRDAWLSRPHAPGQQASAAGRAGRTGLFLPSPAAGVLAGPGREGLVRGARRRSDPARAGRRIRIRWQGSSFRRECKVGGCSQRSEQARASHLPVAHECRCHCCSSDPFQLTSGSKASIARALGNRAPQFTGALLPSRHKANINLN